MQNIIPAISLPAVSKPILTDGSKLF